ncbi:MAG: hypothetical protein N2257_05445 [Thermodesulfovibrionales bacterium]|nr:hypothetical protein [Thermodesulfovibrionales bacterium]
MAGSITCPYLGEVPDGKFCNINHKLIIELEDADLSLCMSRHYEACVFYIYSLIAFAREHMGVA